MGCGACGHKYPGTRPSGQSPQVMGRYRVRPVVIRRPSPPPPTPPVEEVKEVVPEAGIETENKTDE